MNCCVCYNSGPSKPKSDPTYQDVFTTSGRIRGCVGVALVALGIAALVIVASGGFKVFPHNFAQAVSHIDPTKLAIGLGVTTILIGGAAYVIHRARTRQDELVQSTICKSRDFNKHIETVRLDMGGSQPYLAYIDTSTLDSKGTGNAYLYAVKPLSNHYIVSSLVFLTTPVVVVGSIVYHALRMCVVPFYIAYRLCCGDKRFKKMDIFIESGRSLLHILKAPFYGLALMGAALYSMVNPMGGRILGAKIERDWNHDASRVEGFWSVGGRQTLWWNPGKFGQFNFFLAGCWQPLGVVKYENNKIVKAQSLTKTVDEFKQLKTLKGRDYVILPKVQV